MTLCPCPVMRPTNRVDVNDESCQAKHAVQICDIIDLINGHDRMVVNCLNEFTNAKCCFRNCAKQNGPKHRFQKQKRNEIERKKCRGQE